ncbi:MAG TPA: hypothetical protein DCG19_00540, partial [Cryomorphaceae bacterium]|nr:hypothetical protein [Cryomorphaceae bacterium]
MEKFCLECGEPIKGRQDKKFCGDSCRNSYNNRQNKTVNNLVRNINRVLNKNRRILSELNPYGKSKTTRDVLIGKGFDFNHFTGIYETRKGGRYYFVYDQG